jgi:hypothetical protein
MNQQNYIQAARLPPGWAPNTDLVAVMQEMKARLDRLKALDVLLEHFYETNLKERKFIHALLDQLIKTGHS